MHQCAYLEVILMNLHTGQPDIMAVLDLRIATASERMLLSSLGTLIGQFDALSVSSTFIHENILNSDGKIGSISCSRSRSPCDLLTTAQISVFLLFAFKNQSHFPIFFFFSFMQIGYRLIFASRAWQTHMHILSRYTYMFRYSLSFFPIFLSSFAVCMEYAGRLSLKRRNFIVQRETDRV